MTARRQRPRAPQIPGLKYRVLDHWVKRGYLRPLLEFPDRPAGSGNRRVWPEAELRIATDMVRLRQHGYTVRYAAAIARQGDDAVSAALGPHHEREASR